MAHFALLDENNIVIFITVGREEDNGKENELSTRTGQQYKQTSYNTREGIYYTPETNLPDEDQSKAFRKNYAGIGYYYDEVRDAFIPPKPYNSWILNEFKCVWEAPISIPDNEKIYEWDENNKQWIEII